MPTNLSKTVGGGGYKNYQLLTTSGTFTVPANVYRLKLGAQGAGASGMGNGYNGSTSTIVPLHSGSGGGAGTYVAVEIDVRPNDVITYIIGQGGIGSAGSGGGAGSWEGGGASGGNTAVRINGKPIVVAEGAPFTISPQSSWGGGGHGCISRIYELVRGGSGANGQFAGSPSGTNGIDGFPPSVYNMFSNQLSSITSFSPMTGFFVTTGGTGDTGTGARGGSGGGSSIFGRGGNGGNAEQLGENAPATSYGAGGGGAGGRVNLPLVAGGNGANGCLEVWY